MAIECISWVIERSKAKGAAAFLLVVIANHAHADGTGAYPSVTTLARESRLSVRQVYNLLPLLVKSGELRIEKGGGPRGTNLYSLPLVGTAKIAGENIAGAKISGEISGESEKFAGAMHCTKGVKCTAPKPSLNRNGKSGTVNLPLPSVAASEFPTFFEVYPRKKKIDEARKAWNQVRKAGTSAEEIMAGLQRNLSELLSREPRFRPYPATWLRGGCWRDEPSAEPLKVLDKNERLRRNRAQIAETFDRMAKDRERGRRKNRG